MNNFKSIQEIFTLIDEKDYEIREYEVLSSIFQKHRDKSQSEGKKDEVELAQWNMDFLSFVFRDNTLRPQVSGINKDNSVFEYPSLLNFNDKTYTHLEHRFKVTRNKYLKARFSHLLWFSPKKHLKYARTAIDNYFMIIGELWEEETKSEKSLVMKLLVFIKNLYYLSKQTKYRYDESKSLLVQLLNKIPQNTLTGYRLFTDLGKIIKEDKKEFQSFSDFNIKDKLWEFVNRLSTEKELWLAIDIAGLGESVSTEKKEKNKWFKKLGEIYEQLMIVNASELAALNMCQKAVYNYEMAGLDKKVDELKKQSNELLKTLPLNPIKIGIDLSETLEKMEEEAKRISEELSPEGIIYLLSSDKNILPKKADMDKAANDMISNSPFLSVIDSTFHDHRGNVVKNITQDEKQYHFLLQNYGIQLYNLCIPFIHWIMYYSVANQKITTELLIKLFNEYSWFGKDIPRQVFGRSTTYNWLEAIIPAIHDYLAKLKYLENSDIHINYIMCVDSLTLKVEGLIRDFLNIQGIPTFKQRRDKKKIIAQEKDLADLLWDKKVIELFDEDDLLFLRFLLVEKTGYNLRNDVAHALLLPQQYNVELMHLLFLAILKIGKFNITVTENEKEK